MELEPAQLDPGPESHRPLGPPNGHPQFTIRHLLITTALIAVGIAGKVACPIYGTAFLGSMIGFWAGYAMLVASKSLARPPEEPQSSLGSFLGIVGAMTIWCALMVSIFALPACAVELSHPAIPPEEILP